MKNCKPCQYWQPESEWRLRERVSFGSGDGARIVSVNPPMVASLETSAKIERHNIMQTRNLKAAIGKPDALDMLASAINYCQQAGLQVTFANKQGRLVLSVPEAAIVMADGSARIDHVPVLAESVASTGREV